MRQESHAQRQIEVNLKLATSTPRVPESIVFPAWVTCTYQHTEMQATALKTDIIAAVKQAASAKFAQMLIFKIIRLNSQS
jgi:hypothetical protein